jgi:hypothetical protein
MINKFYAIKDMQVRWRGDISDSLQSIAAVLPIDKAVVILCYESEHHIYIQNVY